MASPTSWRGRRRESTRCGRRSTSRAACASAGKVRRYAPAVVAAVGVTVFRALFPERKGAVTLGPQVEQIGGASVFVLPNPSGRNANFSYAEMLAAYRLLARHLRRP